MSDEEDSDIFYVPDRDGLKCKAHRGWKVKIGVNQLPKKQQFFVAIANGKDRESAVRRHHKFDAALQLLTSSECHHEHSLA